MGRRKFSTIRMAFINNTPFCISCQHRIDASLILDKGGPPTIDGCQQPGEYHQSHNRTRNVQMVTKAWDRRRRDGEEPHDSKVSRSYGLEAFVLVTDLDITGVNFENPALPTLISQSRRSDTSKG